jgi:hypothetical protein
MSFLCPSPTLFNHLSNPKSADNPSCSAEIANSFLHYHYHFYLEFWLNWPHILWAAFWRPFDFMNIGKLSFGARFALALKVLFSPDAALALLSPTPERAPESKKPAPEVITAPVDNSALLLVSALQREGRFVDFIQQEVTGFSDEEVGAAARVVHQGCSKALKSMFSFKPARGEAEGTTLTLPKGFDAERNRLVGNVVEKPEYRGTLKHAGWEVTDVRLPRLQGGANPKIVAPAEIEIL